MLDLFNLSVTKEDFIIVSKALIKCLVAFTEFVGIFAIGFIIMFTILIIMEKINEKYKEHERKKKCKREKSNRFHEYMRKPLKVQAFQYHRGL